MRPSPAPSNTPLPTQGWILDPHTLRHQDQDVGVHLRLPLSLTTFPGTCPAQRKAGVGRGGGWRLKPTPPCRLKGRVSGAGLGEGISHLEHAVGRGDPQLSGYGSCHDGSFDSCPCRGRHRDLGWGCGDSRCLSACPSRMQSALPQPGAFGFVGGETTTLTKARLGPWGDCTCQAPIPPHVPEPARKVGSWR